MKRALLGGLLAAVVCAQPASALTMIAKYSGVVDSGWDESGLFGSAQTDLTGKAFTAIYRLQVGDGVSLSDFRQTGNLSLFSLNNLLSAKIILDTGSFSLGPLTETQSTFDGQEAFQLAAQETVGDDIITNASLYNYFNGTSGGGGFSFSAYQPSLNYSTLGQADMGLLTRSFSIAVPEPGTWLLMILAFGGMGSMLRAQRRRIEAPAAC